MPKYAILDFDEVDVQDQYAIVYNDHANRSGDCHIEWFDTEEQRARRIQKDTENNIVFLTEWEFQNA